MFTRCSALLSLLHWTKKHGSPFETRPLHKSRWLAVPCTKHGPPFETLILHKSRRLAVPCTKHGPPFEALILHKSRRLAVPCTKHGPPFETRILHKSRWLAVPCTKHGSPFETQLCTNLVGLQTFRTHTQRIKMTVRSMEQRRQHRSCLPGNHFRHFLCKYIKKYPKCFRLNTIESARLSQFLGKN